MEIGNGSDPPSEPAWMNIQYFFEELCRITGTGITGNDIFSHSLGEKILKVLRQRQNELIRFEGLMKSLCGITGVSTGGVDLCSQNFVDSFVEYVQQDLALVEGLRTKFAERRPFRCESREAKASLGTYQSNDENTSSESSELASNEKNNEVPSRMTYEPEDVKIFPLVSQIIPLTTSSVPISPKSTYEAEVGVGTGSGVMVVDTSLNEIIQTPPFPSTSRQLNERDSQTTSNTPGTSTDAERNTKTGQRRKARVLRKKIHVNHGFHEGSHWCSCGSKFKSKVTQEKHIKYLNALWKFKCERCLKKFYDLSKLKVHLKKEHEVEKPLKQFVIGCTLCGIMFKSRSEFGNHKKTEHNIHKVAKPRRPYITPRQSATTSPTLSSPQDLKVEVVDIAEDDTTQQLPRLVNQNEVVDLVSEDEGDNVDGPPPYPQMNHQPHAPLAS